MKTISGIAQERIREAILRGDLLPGSRIDQNQLAQELNTSLIPVREALKKLESEGFVQIIPRRGAFVVDISLADLEHLYHARQIIEGQVAYLAAAHLNENDLARLAELAQQLRQALERDDYDEFTRLNHTFHFIIYNAAGNKYLAEMIAGLWELAERYRFRYQFVQGQHDLINAEHQAILEAAQNHDAPRLQRMIEQHIQQTLVGLRALAARDI
ncbi:MAG: GntR family transcriptional regulator [Anaerolineae bacterium]|nr:GntR family transcriptional regulator [Anaerolineae bacterium]